MTQTKDNSKPQQPLHRFLLWRISALIAVCLLIIVVGTFFVLRNFNPNRYAPALVSALEQATGRHVTLNGPVTIRWSLTPTIQASNITIANPPGFSDQNLLTIGRLRAEFALLPLLSHRADVLRLELIAPHLTLERLQDGKADWDFTLGNPPHTTKSTSFLNSGFQLALEAVEVKDGTLTIKAHNHDTAGVIHFTKLIGTAESLSAPLHLNAQADIGTTPFAITGIVGPVARFSGIGAGPWPLDLDFTLAGARLKIAGTIEHPRDAHGYDLAINLNVPDLSMLGRALPPSLTAHLPLPPVQNLTATATIMDRHATLPAINNLSITAGKSDLSGLRPGLTLSSLQLSMATLTQPFSATVVGTSESGNFSLQGKFGALQSLFPPAWLPAGMKETHIFPLSLTATVGKANAAITGAIATPQTLAGAALAVTANVPDLSALSGITGWPLPAWKNIAVQATVTDPGGVGLYNTAGLDDLVVTMDNAAFGGDATLHFAKNPKLQLALNFTQANMDALLAAFPAPSAAASPAAVPAAPPSSPPLIIPDTPLPLGFLTWGNADVQLSADNVVWNGAPYTALQANAQLADGKLTLGPLTGEIPGGEITANASLDGTSTPATESLSVNAPALALGPLLKAFHLDGSAQGNLRVQLTATSTGNTLHAIVANLNGQFGLASVNGTIDSGLFNQAFGTVERDAGLPPPPIGPATLRCFGLRVDATQGVATVKTFGLVSNQLTLQGTGSLNLGQESFDVTLHPTSGAGLLLGGSFAQPSLAQLPQSIAPVPPGTQNIRQPDICPGTLALARFGQPGPAASPSATSAAAPAATDTNAPKTLLNSLLAP